MTWSTDPPNAGHVKPVGQGVVDVGVRTEQSSVLRRPKGVVPEGPGRNFQSLHDLLRRGFGGSGVMARDYHELIRTGYDSGANDPFV